MSNQRIGARFEEAAERHLAQHGLQPLARNYRCRSGEIDLVMCDAGTVVFVEVRYRRGDRFGSALESITARKRLRILRAAAHFLHTHPALRDRACRFDSVGIDGAADAPAIRWIRDAFAA